MITKELVSYITSQLNDGVGKNDIIAILQSQGGWELTDITEAFLQIKQKKISQTPPPQVVSDINNKQDSPAPVEEKVLALKKSEIQKLNLENNEQNSDNDNNVYARDSILGQATTQKQRASSFGKIIALVVIFLIVCAGTAYGYFEYVQKPIPTLHQLFEEMIIQNQNMESVRNIPTKELSGISLKIGVSNTETMTKIGSLDMNISSDLVYDLSTPTQPLMDGFVTLDAGMSLFNNTMNFVGKGTIDIKMANEKVYFRLRDIALPTDISPYENKWIEIDLALNKNLLEQNLGLNFLANGELNTKLEEKIIQILTKFFSDNEIIEIINRSGQVEKIKNENGEKEYHLTFQATKEDWTILIQKLYTTYKAEYKELIQLWLELPGTQVDWSIEEEKQIQEIFTEIEKQLASKEAEKVFEVLANLSTETWVNIKTMRSRKNIISFNIRDIKIPADYIKEMNIPTAPEEMKLDISFSGTSEREYDVPVNIIAPTDTIMLDELMKKIGFSPMGGIGGGARKKANRLTIEANLRAIQDSSILYYDDHNLSYGTAKIANNICEKDLFDDGMINNVITYAENAGSGKDTAICAIGLNGQTWAVSVGYEDGIGSWCTDSTGYASDDVEKNTATMKTKKDPAVCGPGITVL
ncbi:MAG: hypothetical protein KKD32_20135 [Proteobacteria bacterium]|nr:hypothetical protein [Pseudomonadota bacterium]MBU2416728.1 hypothetical protein [Patescibacteria group bacterium]